MERYVRCFRGGYENHAKKKWKSCDKDVGYNNTVCAGVASCTNARNALARSKHPLEFHASKWRGCCDEQLWWQGSVPAEIYSGTTFEELGGLELSFCDNSVALRRCGAESEVAPPAIVRSLDYVRYGVRGTSYDSSVRFSCLGV